MSITPVARFLAYALFAVAAATLAPALLCLFSGSGDAAGYLFAGGVALFLGGAAWGVSPARDDQARRRAPSKGGLRELLLALLLLWGGVPFVAALPFVQQGWLPQDAWFEAVSGLTTTGGWLSAPTARATLPGALYRATLQGIGGVVSLCTAAAIFVRPEFIGVAPIVPPFARGESGTYLRAFRAAFRVFAPVFAALSLAAAAGFAVLGVPVGEAVVMGLSLSSTGGFVPKAGGIAAYPAAVQVFACLVMALGAVNFIVVAGVASGKGRRMRGGETRETATFVILCPLIALLFWTSLGAGDWSRLPSQLFNAVSVLSTNGILIGEAPGLTPVLVTAVIGGAAVSTAGGIKLLRWLITFRRAGAELWRLTHPGGVLADKGSVNEFGVWIHTIAFTILLAVFVLITGFFGNSLEVSAAAAVAVVANAGPLVDLAPRTTADYVLFDPGLRPLFGVGMIAGRLELVVLLVALNRRFWQS